MINNSVTTSLYQRALDGVWQRQRAIANNIANYETPGYKALKVSFEGALEQEIKKLQSSMASSDKKALDLHALENSKIHVYKDQFTSERADGNNVNLDYENLEMAKTQIQYQYLTRGVTDTFARLRYAISEGKK
ncbi:MAG: flagellar basal body rod protein FlgB [Anaerovoracaceae bacterium]|jgi:flagellar basal-body rod protein FlgB